MARLANPQKVPTQPPQRQNDAPTAPVLSWGLLVGCLAAAALVWVYLPILTSTVLRWGNDARYSHGYLVPLFSLYLLLYGRIELSRRPAFRPSGRFVLDLFAAVREQLNAERFCRPSWWGVPLLLVGLATHAAGTYVYVDWLNAISLLPCLAGLTLLLGGWAALKWAWPAILFLAFMVPLPFWLETGLSQPLQHLGTVVGCYALQTLGFAAYSEGNVICMGTVRIGVVEACSGLSMLVTFFALSAAVAILSPRPLWERFLVAVSAIPIALLANITRIIVTAMMHKVSHYWADLVFHDLAGYLMILLGLGLLWLELRLLSWVLPLREVEEPLALAQKSFGKWH